MKDKVESCRMDFSTYIMNRILFCRYEYDADDRLAIVKRGFL